MSWSPPPILPPPEDAVALYVRWQAAEEHLAELKRTLPPADYSNVGGIVTPLRDQRLIEAGHAEIEASLAFHRHPWWFGAFNKVQAEQVIAEAARQLAEGL